VKIKVLFFASLREEFGEPYRLIDVEEGVTVGEVVRAFFTPPNPGLFERKGLLFAVNEEFEDENKRLKDGDQLAIMTPMSGG